MVLVDVGDVIEIRLRHDVKDSVGHLRQGWVEVLLLESPVSTIQSE